jgi:hypothetical protein
MPDTATNALYPTFQLQDHSGEYSNWLLSRADEGEIESLYEQIWQNRLPLQMVGSNDLADALPSLFVGEQIQTAYGYVSYVTPSTTLRQMVLGASDTFRSVFTHPARPFSTSRLGRGQATTG